MSSEIDSDRASNIQLLDRFYGTFSALAIAFLAIGVPFVFYRKGAAAAAGVILLGLAAAAWLINRKGRPQESLKLFACGSWLILVALIFGGLPPIIAAMLAVAVMLSVVVSLRAGILYGGTYMLAWLAYVVLGILDLAPPPYFVGNPLVMWFLGAIAIWLVLLPIPALIRNMRMALSLQRVTLEATSDGVLVIDDRRRVVAYNGQFASLWRIPPDVIAGSQDKDLLDFVIGQLKEPRQFLDRVNELYEHPGESSADTLQFKDGRVFERYSRPQRMDGKVSGRVWSFRDVTERKQAEEEQRIAAIAFEAQEGIVITDARSVILRVNRAFSEITGYTVEEAVGQKTRLLSSGRHDADFYAAMWKSIKQTGAWQGEIWNRRKNGEVYPQWLTITAVKRGDGVITHYVGTQIDITERKAAEAETEKLAYCDPLTQLANRRLLLDRLQHALAFSARNGDGGALLFLDLDKFKTLNDTLGHDKGDLLLQQVAQRLLSCVREGDTVARLGGDEFVVMLEGLSESSLECAAQADVVGKKILAALNQPYMLADHEYHSTPSIGGTLFFGHRDTADELLKQADLAMYQVKAAGRNGLRFFDSGAAM